MRILVTRPEPDASGLAKRLMQLGHEPLIEPLLVTHFEPVDDLDLEGVQALIATSRNAIRALAGKPDVDTALDLPLYAVGPGTAATARAHGFRAVIEGSNAARDLLTLISLDADINGGPLLYLAPARKAFDLPAELRRLGFHVLEPIVYETRPSEYLSPAALAAIQAGAIDAVMLFSPATARNWARLATKHGIAARVRAIRHFCLSRAIADELAGLQPHDVACAIQPNLEQMLALLTRPAPQSGR